MRGCSATLTTRLDQTSLGRNAFHGTIDQFAVAVGIVICHFAHHYSILFITFIIFSGMSFSENFFCSSS